MNKIVTISREFGSGGRELGRRLAEGLGFAYYDQEIIVEIAQRTKLAEDYVQQIIESRPSFSFPIHIGVTFQISSNELFRQKATVFADYILRHYNPFRIFVYAGMERKMERCRLKGKSEKNLSEKELKRCILSVDKRRAEYYSFATGQPWGEKRNYDICLNSTNMTIKDISPYIVQMLSGSVWQ